LAAAVPQRLPRRETPAEQDHFDRKMKGKNMDGLTAEQIKRLYGKRFVRLGHRELCGLQGRCIAILDEVRCGHPDTFRHGVEGLARLVRELAELTGIDLRAPYDGLNHVPSDPNYW
jgi:hypothetical protein